MKTHYSRNRWLIVLLVASMLLVFMPALALADDPQDSLLYAFVANAEEASVSKVDLVNNIEVARYSTILDRTGGTDAWNDCRVSRLTMDPAGNAWALNSMTGSGVNYATQQGQVIRISARPVAGEAPGVTTSNTGGLAGIVIPDIRVSIFNVGALADLPRTINVIEDSGHTYLWIGFYGGGYYQKYEYTGTELVAVGAKVLLPTGFRPYTSAITEEGILWGASRNANPYGPTTTVGVFKFDINGPPVTATSMPYDPPGGNNPYFTYVMDNGDVWISDGDWNSSTKEFAVYPAGGGGPLYYNAGTYTAMRGFTEVAGDVWATTINGQVLKGEWNGATWLWTVVVTGLGELTGVAMDPEGYLWAVSYGTDRLYKFDPDDPNNGIWVGVGDGPYAYGDFVAPPLPAALGDYVWYDTNMNGIQDVGELGVPDVTVNLYTCADEFVATMDTDSDGYYLFDELPAGSYKVEFILPGGFVFSPQDQGGDDSLDSDADVALGYTTCVTLIAGETNLTLDAGIYVPTYDICGFKWEIEEGNPGDGWTINLLKWDGDSYEPLTTATTGADGKYCFHDLLAGQYLVEEVLKDGWIQLSPGNNEHLVTLPGGETDLTDDPVLYYNFLNDTQRECFDETAWAADGAPGITRFVPTKGNWATYVKYNVADGNEAQPVTYELYAGQTHLAGYLYVYDFEGTLYVKYATGAVDNEYKDGYCGDWTGISEYHLAVVDEFAGFNPFRTYNKKTGYGSPIPGSFEYKDSWDPANPVNETEWIEVDVADYEDADIYIAAHAVMWWCGYPCDGPAD